MHTLASALHVSQVFVIFKQKKNIFRSSALTLPWAEHAAAVTDTARSLKGGAVRIADIFQVLVQYKMWTRSGEKGLECLQQCSQATTWKRRLS